MPRTLSQLSGLALFSAVTMFLATLLSVIFSGVEAHPAGWIEGSDPIVTLFPVEGTTFVTGMSAFLNIVYT